PGGRKIGVYIIFLCMPLDFCPPRGPDRGTSYCAGPPSRFRLSLAGRRQGTNDPDDGTPAMSRNMSDVTILRQSPAAGPLASRFRSAANHSARQSPSEESAQGACVNSIV